jgi:hypothetical protein
LRSGCKNLRLLTNGRLPLLGSEPPQGQSPPRRNWEICDNPLAGSINPLAVQYLPTILMYRLWVADSPQPIIVPVGRGWLPNGALNRRTNLAIQYVTKGIGNRLETRWLPW